MHLYKEYIQERTSKQILGDERGFAVYSYVETAVYIEDIFVLKDFRQSGIAAKMANEIADEARKKEIKIMLGSVDPLAKGADDSIKVLHAYGMKVTGTQNGLIFFKKDI